MAIKSTKVDSTSVTDVKSDRKGNKRGANKAIEKVLSAKKQKMENDEAVIAKLELEKQQPNKVEPNHSEESSKSKEVVKAALLKNNQSHAMAAPLVAKNANDNSSDSLNALESDEKPKAIEIQPCAAVKSSTNKDTSSDQFDSGSDSESCNEEVKKVAPPSMSAKNGALPSSEKKDQSDDANDTKLAKENDEPFNAPVANNDSKKSGSSGDSPDKDSEENEEIDDDHSLKTPKKKDMDIEMVDASEIPSKKSDVSTTQTIPMTPASQQALGSKTLFVGNLSFKVKENDVIEFFKTVAEVVEVRLARRHKGGFRGFGHVEFATPEDAQKALDSFNGELLLNRRVILDLARERVVYTPNSRENNKGGPAPSLTTFVMGFDKSSAKDEVDSTPGTDVKSAKKGNKRGPNEAIEKDVSAKKQKLENDEAVIANKQKLEKQQPKKVESSISEEPSKSEEGVKLAAVLKEDQSLAKASPIVTKNAKDSSSDSFNALESDVSDEKPRATDEQPSAAIENCTKSDTSSDESDSGSDSKSCDEEVEKVAPPSMPAEDGALPSSKKKDQFDDVNAKEPSAEASKDDEISNEEPSKGEQANGTKLAKENGEPSNATVTNDDSKKSGSSGESPDKDSEEGDDDHSLKTPKKKDIDVEMVDASQIQSKESNLSTAERTLLDSLNGEPLLNRPMNRELAREKGALIPNSRENNKAGGVRSLIAFVMGFDRSLGQDEPKTPSSQQALGSKTLFVGNLSFKVKENDVIEFFKTVAEVVEVRLACHGASKGCGHVDFATPEDAQKALDSLNGELLLNRPVHLELAHERGACTPNSRENDEGDGAPSLTALVTGFDKSLGKGEIRSVLQNHFGSCGNITRMSISKVHKKGVLTGMAFIYFEDSNGFNKALELDGSEVKGWQLVVTVAKKRSNGGGRGEESGSKSDGCGGSGGGSRGGKGGGGKRHSRKSNKKKAANKK